MKQHSETLRAQGGSKIDKTDAASAVLRSDLRRMWLEADPGNQVLLLKEPTPMLAAALLELPQALSGLTDEQADDLREAAFEAEFPALADNIAELADVEEFATAALRVARDAVMQQSGLTKADFDLAVWNGTPAPAVDV